ncbi:MAG TPA: LysM peptidoglycan-binding domain-containing protein, partial [Polyangiaceae bacterium]|nr:LysM peptidoglycan-binding domain-containing protein [Polyangiaceae bacterium]
AAQGAGGGAAPAGGGGAAPAAGGGSTVVFPTYPNAVVAPVPEGGVLGGGNVTGSSSKPITGPGDRDGFDLRAAGGGGGTVRGRENGSFIFGGVNARRNPNATVHSVRKGDTLWHICDQYFSNPYQWPRIWSYNPEIQNPHWIYPGDQVRLRPGADVDAPATTAANAIRGPALVPAGTVFLRNGGYIEDQSSNWGEINGSPEDKMLLTEGDEVYIRFADNREVKEGQLLTIYRPQGAVRGNGQMIAIQGTVRVDNWRAKDHTARARIVEALDVIERGARIGPIQRRFEVVPPQRNEAETAAQVIASVRNHNFYGQDQVVFIDKGEDAKVKPGNRLLVLRKGDAWHESFIERRAVDRIALESNSPAATETVPRPKDTTKLPEEIVGELRVITVGKHSSMCILLGTRREIELGDKVFLRKGY